MNTLSLYLSVIHIHCHFHGLSKSYDDSNTRPLAAKRAHSSPLMKTDKALANTPHRS